MTKKVVDNLSHTLLHHKLTGPGAREAMFMCSVDERRKQRMRFERLGFELGMELASEEPRVVGQFDDLDKILVRRDTRNDETAIGKTLLDMCTRLPTLDCPLQLRLRL